MRMLAGVDGCKGGFVAALRPEGAVTPPCLVVFTTFAALLAAIPGFAAIAIDMPIGLPERIEGSGRGPEQAVRPLLGARQSSVFSIPVRAAVEAPDYRSACDAAYAGSNPPKKVSKQGFFLFPKIREIDVALRWDASLIPRIVESHPEVIFRHLKGEPLHHPKKTAEGRFERRALLIDAGYDAAWLDQPIPPGAAPDDAMDALASGLPCGMRKARRNLIPNPSCAMHSEYPLPFGCNRSWEYHHKTVRLTGGSDEPAGNNTSPPPQGWICRLPALSPAQGAGALHRNGGKWPEAGGDGHRLL
jgi:predicted RNase H-like nuclease